MAVVENAGTALRTSPRLPLNGRLAKTLGPFQATALAVSIVVGSGLLVLPGVAYRSVGRASIYTWLASALLVAPLLVVFASLGRRYPGAGGIAGYVQAGFGRPAAAATEVVLIGTLALGLATVALSGGFYLAGAVGGGRPMEVMGTAALLAVAAAVNLGGTRLSGRVQQVLAFTLVTVIAVASVLTLGMDADPGGAGVAGPSQWTAGLPALGAVFFAFTGWEMLSFTTEEYRRPERDFPIAIAASFAIVTLLYVAVAVALQLTVPVDDTRLTTAPISAGLSSVLGPMSGRVVAAIGVVVITANLVGATWAASRLVLSSARQRLLPTVLARVEPNSSVPRLAVLVVVLTIGGVTVLFFTGLISIDALFGLAGQNFILLYGVCALVHVRLARRWRGRAFGLATLALVALASTTFGRGLSYPIALAMVGAVAHRLRRRRQSPLSSETPPPDQEHRALVSSSGQRVP